MIKKITGYLDAKKELPETYLAWPLFGSGIENLGKNGKPISRPIPEIRSNEILMRIDACSLCYTDVKAVTLGSKHPRFIGKDLSTNPVVPGHELTMTVVKVGDDLSEHYHIGERYTMQPNIWVNGKSMPFCFEYDGGLRQYAVIGEDIIHGDEGNYLIPIHGNITYASSALAEPWSCVEAAYRMIYRQCINNNGVVWFCGCDNSRNGYQINKIWGNPKRVLISDIPSDLEETIIHHYQEDGIEPEIHSFQSIINQNIKIDDILILDGNTSMIDAASEKLNTNGILTILNNKPLDGMIKIDLGKLHYDMIAYIGTHSLTIDDAYLKNPIRTELFQNGYCWILGAGGPLGRMHLQRALEMERHPNKILATNRGLERLSAVWDDFSNLAHKKNIELDAISPTHHQELYKQYLHDIGQSGGFQDIVVMVARAETVADAIPYLSQYGVLNLFAGINRGITAEVDAWSICGPKQIRLIGHSGSNLNDQIHTVKKILEGNLQPELSVAAVGGLNQLIDGLQAMIDEKYTGKIIIYPHIVDFPLTALNEFQSRDPEVYDALIASKFWGVEAEKIFLENHLA
jgi:threonine dehydrogenase-like Zn-dependent dehydrogenase